MPDLSLPACFITGRSLYMGVPVIKPQEGSGISGSTGTTFSVAIPICQDSRTKEARLMLFSSIAKDFCIFLNRQMSGS